MRGWECLRDALPVCRQKVSDRMGLLEGFPVFADRDAGKLELRVEQRPLDVLASAGDGEDLLDSGLLEDLVTAVRAAVRPAETGEGLDVPIALGLGEVAETWQVGGAGAALGGNAGAVVDGLVDSDRDRQLLGGRTRGNACALLAPDFALEATGHDAADRLADVVEGFLDRLALAHAAGEVDAAHNESTVYVVLCDLDNEVDLSVKRLVLSVPADTAASASTSRSAERFGDLAKHGEVPSRWQVRVYSPVKDHSAFEGQRRDLVGTRPGALESCSTSLWCAPGSMGSLPSIAREVGGSSRGPSNLDR